MNNGHDTYVDAEIVEKLQRRQICTSQTADVVDYSIFSDISLRIQTNVINNKKYQSNLGRAASLALTAENNYATESQLVTIGCPTFTPKLPLPIRPSPPPSNTPIRQPITLTIPNGIQIQSAILPHYTLRTDRQTDTPTDGIGDKSAPTPA